MKEDSFTPQMEMNDTNKDVYPPTKINLYSSTHPFDASKYIYTTFYMNVLSH